MDAAAPADTVYFDDLQVGDHETLGPYRVDAEEMLAFARHWDPLPIHVDEAAARRSVHGTLIASGIYTIAVKQHLLANHCRWRGAVIGAAGYDELRFPKPVHAGDHLSFRWEVTDKRASRSKPDRGIVRFRMQVTDQDGDTVLSYLDSVMLARRPPQR